MSSSTRRRTPATAHLTCPCQDESSPILVERLLPTAFPQTASGSIRSGVTTTITAKQRHTPVLCAACVNYRLETLRERRRRIKEERDFERQACQTQMDQNPALETIHDLQEQVRTTRHQLEYLRQQCTQRAMDVARQTCENDERRQRLDQAQTSLLLGPFLARLKSSLLDTEIEGGGSLPHAIEQTQRQVRLLRFTWASRAFLMHRLDVHIPTETQGRKRDTSSSSGGSSSVTPKVAKGIGKIGGLPLPHAGAELYGVLPPKELESALRLVASVTCLVASCLGIVLPHPILLLSSSSVSLVGHDLAQDALSQPPPPKRTAPPSQDNHVSSTISSSTVLPSLAASTASLANLMGKTAQKVWGGATAAAAATLRNPLLLQDTQQTTVVPPPMDSNIVSERIQHASAAIIAEDASPNSSRYSLSAQATAEEQYAIGLQLLQNNVVTLCIRAGVPVADLWPAQAVLLNLQALSNFCQAQCHGS